MALERSIQTQVFTAIGSLPSVRVFRNNVGRGYVGQVANREGANIVLVNSRVIDFGLHIGSGDLIGWQSVAITQGMVGRTIARFLSVETKSHSGRATTDQTNWAQQVRAAGGVAGIVRSVDQAVTLLNEGLPFEN